MTPARVAELREEFGERFARLEERMEAVERRHDVGDVLAEEIGAAVVRTVRRARTPRPKGTNL